MIDLFTPRYRNFAAQYIPKVITIGVRAEVRSRTDAGNYDGISKVAVTAPKAVISMHMGCRSDTLVQNSD